MSREPELSALAKQLFTFLIKLPGFESFTTSRGFKLILVEHDLDTSWTGTAGSLQARVLPRALTFLGEEGGHSRETLVWFINNCLLGTRKEKTLAFLDDVLGRFRHVTSSPIDLKELKGVLRLCGYTPAQISSMRLFSSAAEISKETIITDVRPYQAYKQLGRIISSCQNELKIIDPWIDEELITLYLESIPASVSIRIVTKNLSGKFELVAKKFKQQRKTFEVRLADIHDRYIIVDDRAWIVGQSIKDAGKKPLAIIELSEPSKARNLFSKLWSQGKQIL